MQHLSLHIWYRVDGRKVASREWEDVDREEIDFAAFKEAYPEVDTAVLTSVPGTQTLGIDFSQDPVALVLLPPSDAKESLCQGCAVPPTTTTPVGETTKIPGPTCPDTDAMLVGNLCVR
jgi:hypothetical protein